MANEIDAEIQRASARDEDTELATTGKASLPSRTQHRGPTSARLTVSRLGSLCYAPKFSLPNSHFVK